MQTAPARLPCSRRARSCTRRMAQRTPSQRSALCRDVAFYARAWVFAHADNVPTRAHGVANATPGDPGIHHDADAKAEVEDVTQRTQTAPPPKAYAVGPQQ